MKGPVRRWWSRWTARLSKLRPTVRDVPGEDQLRILMFADRLGPTLQINWMRPLAEARRRGSAAVWLVEERPFEQRAALLGDSGMRRDLDLLFRELRPHLVAVSRYGGAGATEILAAARRHDAPLVFHIDDNLLAVEPELGAAKIARYAAPERIAALRSLLTEADLVYVSTEALRRQLEALGLAFRACFVGAIAGGADVVRRHDRRLDTKALTIGYMASSSHAADLAMVIPALLRVLDERPEVRVEIFGSLKVPEALAQKACRAHPPVGDYDSFLERLASLPWDIGLAPLRSTDFNLAKTNTKWIEYTAAGIPVICSDHPVYRDVIAAGAAAAPAADDRWYEVICAMIDDPEKRHAQLAMAQRLLEREYSLQRLRGQVAEVISRLGSPALAEKLDPTSPRQAG